MISTEHSNNNDPESSIEDETVSTNSDFIRVDLTGVTKILIIGETGSGKSTFINYLLNYFLNGTYDNPRIAIPSTYYQRVTENFRYQENDIQNRTSSKTVKCNQYMFSKNNKQYAFIDTPGLSDTRGPEQDQKNIQQIINKIEQLGGLTAVIIVVNGTIGRHTINLRNVLVQLRGNLPDTIMDQVILVLTHTTRYESNFQIEDLKIPGTIYPFYMQNSAFSQDPHTWTNDARARIRNSWNETMLKISHILETIDTFQEKSVEDFKTMKDLRNQIKILLHEARLQMSQLQKIKDEVLTFEDLMKQFKNQQISYKDYTTTHEVEKIDIVDAEYHSTLCQKCNNVCHEDCALDEITEIGDEVFQQCWAIEDGFCTQCIGKCSYSEHYHAKKKINKTIETMNDIIVEIKEKYDEVCNKINDYQQKITSTEDTKLMIDQALEKRREDIKNVCLELNKKCSGFNLAQELYSFVEQLKIEANMLHCLDAKEQAEKFIVSLKKLCDKIAEDQYVENNKVPAMKIMNTERPTSSSIVFNLPEESQQFDDVSNQTTDETLSNQPKSHSNKVALQTFLKLAKKKTNVEENKSSDNNDKNDFKKKSLPPASKTGGSKKVDEPKSTVTTLDPKEHPKLSVSELVQRYHQCSEERIRKSIIYELELRTLGKSSGIMNAPNAHITFMNSSRKYYSYNINDLNTIYEELKNRINVITGPDILDIAQIPIEDFIEIHAVYSQIEELKKTAPPAPSPSNIYQNWTHSRTIDNENNYIKSSDQLSDNMSTISVRSSPSGSISGYENTNIENMSTKTLLSEYNLSLNIDRDSRRNTLIFNELRRRCHGDYLSLIEENPKLFIEQYKKHEKKTVDILKQKIDEIKTNIDDQIEYNFSRIEEVRKEKILELAALNYLIDPTTIRIPPGLEELNTSKPVDINEDT